MTAMRDEIAQIPDVVSGLLADGVGEVSIAADAIRAADPRWCVIVGRGTSDHAATYARYLIETRLGIPTGLAAPSVSTIYRADLDWRGGLVIGVSQSGASPDVVEVVARGRAGGGLTIAVTNEAGSPLASAARHVLACRAGVERSVAATKTYVAELVVLAALVERVHPSSELSEGLTALPATLAGVVRDAADWIESSGVVDAVAGAERALVVSRGFNLATALETALKLKEVAGVFADGYSTADFEHGPVVLAGPDVPVVAFRPDGAIGTSIDGALARLARAGAEPWFVGGPEVEGAPRRHGPLALRLRLPEALTPAAFAIPGLMLAEAVAGRRGRDPDAPVGLTKVTLTR